MTLIAVELFAGAGGAALGLRTAGFRSLAAVEMWPRAVEVLKAAGFPAIEGRVEEPRVVLEVERRIRSAGRLDLLWASPPCQPYSSAGLRKGELDERDGWAATLAYVQRTKPRAVIIENVSDAPVDVWARAIAGEGGLEHAGTFRLRSRDFGDAQDRPRAFVYAGSVPLVEFQRVLEEHRRPHRSLADVLPHLAGHYVRAEQTTAKARSAHEACPTLSTKGNLYVHKLDVGVRKVGYKIDSAVSRRMTVDEFRAVQGFPADYPFLGTTQDKYKMIGNSVSPAVSRAIGLTLADILSRRSGSRRSA